MFFVQIFQDHNSNALLVPLREFNALSPFLSLDSQLLMSYPITLL